MELNQVIIKNINLLLSSDKFSKKFSNYTIFFLINFFSDYNQVKLDRKSQNLITFMTLLSIICMKTLAQNAINLVT